MNKRIFSLAVLLLAAVTSFASNTRSFGAQNQFHFPPAARPGAKALKSVRSASTQTQRGARPTANSTRPTKPHANLNPPVSQIGFVTATQIPAGGAISYLTPALQGDFNGDGKNDIVTVSKNSSAIFSVSVALGNGNGTFQAPKLTAIPGNVYDSFAVGDLNNDGKDDVIIIHRGAGASFDVMLSNGDGTFTVGSNYAITSGVLAGGILYDSNADGKLDLLAIDSGNPGNVWTLLGNGDGTFQPATSFALPGQAGGSLVFGDFNNDGLLDFAENDFSTFQLTVYLALTPTTFAPGVSYTTSDGVYDGCSNTAGDLTGDGFPEIVSANCGDNTITIYVNNGTGGFLNGQGVYYAGGIAPSSSSTAYVQPYAVSIADVNGDGIADVVSTNYYSGDVTVLLGNGDGTVQLANHGYATGGYPNTAPVLADFNGDGVLDLVVTDDIYSFAYLQGFGDGSFRAAVNYYAPTTDNGELQAYDIATGDFNGDGFPDVVIGNCCSDATAGITVFLSNGDGTLAPGVNYGTGGTWEYVAVADFNQDGKLDIATLDVSSGTIQIYNGAGNGTFTVGPTAATGDIHSKTLIAADFNKDGFPDLAVANSTNQNLGVFLNNTLGNFSAETTLSLSGAPDQVLAADVNKDGKLDLLGLEAGCGCVAVLLGNGDGTFGVENDASIGNIAFQIAVGDLNGDGNPDLVIAIDDTVGGEGIQVALGKGDGTFNTPSAVYPSTLQPNFLYLPTPSYLSLVDLDGNGKLDAVFTNSNYGTVGVMYGVGDGTFFDPVEYPTGGGAYGLALADMNGDGAVDVITANDYTSAATVMLNTSVSGNTLASSPNPAAVTQTITFTSTVAASLRGVSTVPTGTVTFFDGATSLGVGTVTAGVATYSTKLAIGTHSITAHYSGDANFHASISTALSQSVTITSDGTTLKSSANPVVVGTSITLTATVATSLSGVSTAPTGTVTFSDGASSIGSGSLTAGVATLTTSTLAVGTHSITASYAGDANFSASASSALSQVITVVPPTPDYTVAASPTSATVTAGSAGTYTITLTPTNSYDGTVTFTCGTLPTKTTCAFSKPTLTPSGSTALTTTLTLQTTANTAALSAAADFHSDSPRSTPGLLASLSGIGIFGLLLAGSWKKNRRMAIILGAFALGMVVMLAACGGGGHGSPLSGGTTAGSYTVTVTATGTAGTNNGDTTPKTLPVTLIVQ
jgi:hypothetical protein